MAFPYIKHDGEEYEVVDWPIIKKRNRRQTNPDQPSLEEGIPFELKQVDVSSNTRERLDETLDLSKEEKLYEFFKTNQNDLKQLVRDWYNKRLRYTFKQVLNSSRQ